VVVAAAAGATAVAVAIVVAAIVVAVDMAVAVVMAVMAVVAAVMAVVAVDMAAIAVVAATAGKANPISPDCKLSSSALIAFNPAAGAPRQGYFFSERLAVKARPASTASSTRSSLATLGSGKPPFVKGSLGAIAFRG
jgi:hypothetical protein